MRSMEVRAIGDVPAGGVHGCGMCSMLCMGFGEALVDIVVSGTTVTLRRPWLLKTLFHFADSGFQCL